MLEIEVVGKSTLMLIGRFDASQVQMANELLAKVTGDEITVDFSRLDYISSAGLSVLLILQKRIQAAGQTLYLTNLKPHIANVFRISGFDKVFTMKN